ncbi:MAG TPA: alkaline phosphatase family protein [Terriglobales bacterium]
MLHRLLAIFLTGSLAAFAATGTTTPSTPSSTVSPDTTGSAYASNHVFVVILENRSDAEALQYMPYTSNLAAQYTRLTQAYAASHGSWLAYGEMAAGIAPSGGTALNGQCNGAGCKTPITGNNMVRQMHALNKTWKGYFQSLPSTGFMGYSSGSYVRFHNPFPYLSDVHGSTTEQKHMVRDTQLATDLMNGDVANYNFLIPDISHDGHNPVNNEQSALSTADNYLAGILPTLLGSKYFQPGGDGVLLITFDESELNGDNHCGTSPETNKCGGHIFTALIGPNVKKAYLDNVHHTTADMLKTTCDLLGIASCPGDGAKGAGAPEAFGSQVPDNTTCTAPHTAGATVCTPTSGQSYSSSLKIMAAGMGPNGTTSRMELWIDGAKHGQWSGNQISTTLNLSAGTHRVVAVAVDKAGAHVNSAPVNCTTK